MQNVDRSGSLRLCAVMMLATLPAPMAGTSRASTTKETAKASGVGAAALASGAAMTNNTMHAAKDTRTLRERYDDVRARVAAAAERSGRRAGDIMLVAVTKYASIEEIRELVSFGHIDLGENRVQQMVQRAAMIDEFNARRRERGASAGDVPPVRWHMIGSLQRNKVRAAIEVSKLSTRSTRCASPKNCRSTPRSAATVRAASTCRRSTCWSRSTWRASGRSTALRRRRRGTSST